MSLTNTCTFGSILGVDGFLAAQCAMHGRRWGLPPLPTCCRLQTSKNQALISYHIKDISIQFQFSWIQSMPNFITASIGLHFSCIFWCCKFLRENWHYKIIANFIAFISRDFIKIIYKAYIQTVNTNIIWPMSESCSLFGHVVGLLFGRLNSQNPRRLFHSFFTMRKMSFLPGKIWLGIIVQRA
jgi:hypothetical protein